MTEKIAAVMGTMAFVFAIVFGLIYGVSEEKVLQRAVISLVIFFLLAMIIGYIAHLIVNEKLKALDILQGDVKTVKEVLGEGDEPGGAVAAGDEVPPEEKV